jgi:hypothetical protein
LAAGSTKDFMLEKGKSSCPDVEINVRQLANSAVGDHLSLLDHQPRASGEDVIIFVDSSKADPGECPKLRKRP